MMEFVYKFGVFNYSRHFSWTLFQVLKMNGLRPVILGAKEVNAELQIIIFIQNYNIGSWIN